MLYSMETSRDVMTSSNAFTLKSRNCTPKSGVCFHLNGGAMPRVTHEPTFALTNVYLSNQCVS